MLQAAHLIGFKSRLTPVASWSLQNEEWACKAPWHAAPAAPTGAWPLSRHPCTAGATVLTAPRAPQAGTSGPARAPASGEPPLLPQAGPLASLPACLHVSTGLRAAGQPLARHVVSTPQACSLDTPTLRVRTLRSRD